MLKAPKCHQEIEHYPAKVLGRHLLCSRTIHALLLHTLCKSVRHVYYTKNVDTDKLAFLPLIPQIFEVRDWHVEPLASQTQKKRMRWCLV